jgi:CheY-like chemotaxis protein
MALGPTKLHQIVMNLATNAYHAMEDSGGRLKISVQQVQSESEEPDNRNLVPGTYARLTVSDNGVGMGKEIMNKVFDPYFTTKETGKGTGLGLSVVHGIVMECGGEIILSSEPGVGTDIHVYLPVISDEAFSRMEVSEPIIGGSERILLVDDEKPIAEMEQQLLERLGYRVTIRTGSIEALEAFRSSPDKYDMVITDMTMPNMTGTMLAQEIKKIKSDIPIIICTGFSDQLTEEKCNALGIRTCLLKHLLFYFIRFGIGQGGYRN